MVPFDIKLTDGRKAKVLGAIGDKAILLLEDGRQVYWPINKIPLPPKEGEETLNVVKIPAIDRLEEFTKDLNRVKKFSDLPGVAEMTEDEYKVFDDLFSEAEQEFKNKWGLT